MYFPTPYTKCNFKDFLEAHLSLYSYVFLINSNILVTTPGVLKLSQKY